MNLQQQLRQPMRYPDSRNPYFMSKRARWLLVLGFLLPGSAQILTGKARKLGRFALGATLSLIGAALLIGIFWFVSRETILTLVTNKWFLLAFQAILVGYALLWVIVGLHTLSLLRLPRVGRAWRLPLALISLAVTLLPAVAVAQGVMNINAGRELINAVFKNDGPAVAPINGRYNILLLGTDAGADREGLRPDSISLISVEAETGRAVVIGLPRELNEPPFREGSPMERAYPKGFGVKNGCHVGKCQLNHVYAEAQYFMPGIYPDAKARNSEPGIEATKDAVSGATGLQVQFYVMLNMDSFERLIDALGGVTVNVPERLPIGGDAYGNGVEGYIEPGQQKLDGFHAIWFARSRYGSATGDYARMERQRDLQEAILRQMTPAKVLSNFQAIAASSQHLVSTDIPQSMLGKFSDLALKSREFPMERVELTPANGVAEGDPDYNVVLNLVRAGVEKASKPADKKKDR
ncbi:MAG: LCP family protein [Microbacteriaceae bacterium]|nr:LCP family protein [Microbacteriaceae bacterium]